MEWLIEALGRVDPMLATASIWLGASVAAVAVFKRLGLGSVLGYLAAGAAIGPSGLGLIAYTGEELHVAEFGVVLLLFVIGLELQPSRLWRMRSEILGLGLAQVLVTGAILALELEGIGFAHAGAILVGLALALSSTAFGVQILRERREMQSPYGRRAFSILLFQDMAVVPLLALAAFLAPTGDAGFNVADVALGVLAIAGLLIAGKVALPWFFRVLALWKANEAFTAGALLIVVNSALVMQAAGLSMALGAFLAGVMLAETEFRHQVETDIEPFRSLLLGLFFMAVGLSVDWGLAAQNLGTVLGGATALFATKALIIYALMRRRGSGWRDSLRAAALLGQAGEFAFVLLTIASESWLIGQADSALLTATVGVSMALTPAAVIGADRWIARRDRETGHDGVEPVVPLGPGRVIVAGFGRAGQIVARMLRMRGYDLTLIDNSPRRIRMAANFGDKVFFGDGARLDVLTMAGAADAKAIFLCINDREGARKAVERLRERFPDQLILAMSYDRFSAIEMRSAGADVVVREVLESAIDLAKRGLAAMGDNGDLEALDEEFRRRDEELMRLQTELGHAEGAKVMREKYELSRSG